MTFGYKGKCFFKDAKSFHKKTAKYYFKVLILLFNFVKSAEGG